MTLFVGNSTVNSSINPTTASIGANSTTTSLFVAANGNVGINTSSPSQKLNISGTDATIRIDGTGSSVSSIQLNPTATAGYFGTISNFPLSFVTGAGGTEKMRITASGDVGIGTTTPASKLQVVGTSWIGGSNNSQSAIAIYSQSATAAVIEAFDPTNSATKRDIGISAFGGNVGIGTQSPSQKLTVSGIGNATGDFRAPIFYDSDNTAYYVNPNDWTKLAGLWTDWGAITFQSTQHKRITSNDGGGNWNFRAGNYMDGSLKYINNGSNGGAATITFTCDGADGVISLLCAPVGVAGANVSYTGSAGLDRYGTFGASGDFRAPIFYDSNNTAYYSDPAATSTLNRISLWSGTTSAIYVNEVAGASSFNYIMAAANDTGTKLVAFVNGSTRNSDGGNNAVVIRNDGGPFVLGSASYATTVTGSTVTVPTDLIVSGGADAIQFNNATSNYISWNSAGVAAPTFTTRSSGTKLVLFPQIGATNADYALGIESGTLWSSVPTTSSQFKWYGGTTLAMTLSGAGSATATADFRAPIFYDSDNTGYYINPDNTSNFNNLTMAGNILPSTVNNTGGGTWYFGTSAWGGNISGANSVTGILYSGGTGSQLFTFASGPAQMSVQVDGSLFSGNSPLTYNPFSINAASIGYVAAQSGVSTAGIIYSNASVRAPQFYDSDNTAYYFDGASTTRTNVIQSDQYRILNSGVFIWQHDSAAANNKFWDTYSGSDGTLNFRTVNDTYTAAVNWLTVTRSGNSPQIITLGGSYTTAAGSLRAPIFYDSNNTAYYCDPADLSVLDRLWVDNNSGDNSTRANVATFTHTVGSNFAVGSDPGDTLRAVTIGVKGSTRPVILTLRNIDNTSAFWDIIADGNTNKFYFQRFGASPVVTFDGSDNVGINRTSPSSKLHVQGTAGVVNDNGMFEIGDSSRNGISFGYNTTANEGWIYPRSVGVAGRPLNICNGGLYVYNTSYAYSPYSLRAPIFYDSDNTAYYIDGAGTSVLNIQKSWWRPWNSGWHVSEDGKNRFFFGNNGRSYYGSQDGFEYRSAADVNIGFLANDGVLYNYNQIRTPILYDQNNTAYYVDPNSTSILNNISALGSVSVGTSDFTTDLAYTPKLVVSGTGPVLYLRETDGDDWSLSALSNNFTIRSVPDVANSSTWTQPFFIGTGAPSNILYITSTGRVGVNNSGPGSKFAVTNGTAGLTSVAMQGVAGNLTLDFNGGGGHFYDAGGHYFRNFAGTTLATIGTALTGTGNRLVYSDANGQLTNSSSDLTLKTNIETIPYGLDAVLQLNPIAFNWKDHVRFGRQREIGFGAQEVQQVIPEVVGINGNDDTLSLDYPKLTAALTKAIQELSAKINNLEAEFDAYKSTHP